MNVSLKLENVVNLNPIRLIHEFEIKNQFKNSKAAYRLQGYYKKDFPRI